MDHDAHIEDGHSNSVSRKVQATKAHEEDGSLGFENDQQTDCLYQIQA